MYDNSWMLISATGKKKKKGYWLFNLTIQTLFPRNSEFILEKSDFFSELWDINSELRDIKVELQDTNAQFWEKG